MRTMAAWGFVANLLLTPMAFAAPESDEDRARSDRMEELERKVEVLAGELERVRTERAIPEDPELERAYGHGPAASKI